MKLKFAVCLILTLVMIAVFAVTGCAQKPEVRAIQVHTWVPGMLSPEEIDETIEWAKKANINVLMVQARRVGDAYYDSAYEPRAKNIKAGPEFDPLAYFIKTGRENNMEVHAWLNIYRVWTGSSKPTDDHHVVNEHPEWISKNTSGANNTGEGMFLDPGAPGVKEYTVKLVADILKKYDVDGIMLDYVRYPGKVWGYSDGAVESFNKMYNRTGKPSADDQLWGRWRRQQVTDTVRAINSEINKTKPWVKLSAATIPWGGCPQDFVKTDAYAAVFQDWRLWMQEGLIDINMPMNYKDPANERHQQWFKDWLAGMEKWSYDRHTWNTIMVMRGNAPGAVEQVKLTQKTKMPGVALFAFSQGGVKDELVKLLSEGAFKEPAPLPEMPWKPKRPAPVQNEQSPVTGDQ